MRGGCPEQRIYNAKKNWCRAAHRRVVRLGSVRYDATTAEKITPAKWTAHTGESLRISHFGIYRIDPNPRDFVNVQW